MMLKAAALLATLVVLAPPSGRPPLGALEREQPRVYDVRYEVTVSTLIPLRQDDPRIPHDPRVKDPKTVQFGGTFALRDTPIVMPVFFRGTYHSVAPDSIEPRLWLGGREDGTLGERFRLDRGLPHHGHMAVLPIPEFHGKFVRWSLSYRLQCYSSRLDERAAAKVPWPRDWPKEVADGLAPQLYIESDDPIFAETVARVSEGNLRFVPPFLAAKDLIRYCLREIRIDRDGIERGRLGILHGMDVEGAATAARNGSGTPHDLVCVCVAMLRAAGIPARPVIGIEKTDSNDQRGKQLISWAEFYLPNTGWIPFDPADMHGRRASYQDVRTPWKGLGTLDDLNRRIPLSYHFMPPRAVESPLAPALWGWDPRPGPVPSAEQRIEYSITSRGTGVVDPQ